MDAIVGKYRDLTITLMTGRQEIKRFYLSYESDTVGNWGAQNGLMSVPDGKCHPHRLMDESLHIIGSLTGLSNRQLCEKYTLDALDLRGLGIELLDGIRQGTITDEASLIRFVGSTLGLVLNKHKSDVGADINRLTGVLESAW